MVIQIISFLDKKFKVNCNISSIFICFCIEEQFLSYKKFKHIDEHINDIFSMNSRNTKEKYWKTKKNKDNNFCIYVWNEEI